MCGMALHSANRRREYHNISTKAKDWPARSVKYTMKAIGHTHEDEAIPSSYSINHESLQSRAGGCNIYFNINVTAIS